MTRDSGLLFWATQYLCAQLYRWSASHTFI